MVDIDALPDFARRGAAAQAGVDAALGSVPGDRRPISPKDAADALTVAAALVDAVDRLKGRYLPVQTFVDQIGTEVEAMRSKLNALGIPA